MANLRNVYAPHPATERGRGILVGGDALKSMICYCSGRSVFLRSLDNPLEVVVYSEHSYPTTVARFSPNGYWVASGDSFGNVRVWARSSEQDHSLKFEIRALSGSIDDLQWSADSQRIIVSGNGKSAQLVKCFMWDSGNNVGEFVGHGKRVLSCDIRPVRPFRAVTAGEDRVANFYEGPPFRFSKSFTEHTNFVNCIRYSPDGSKFVTVGSDRKGYLFDGKTGDKIGELTGSNCHSGSIYAASWSPDSKQLLTVSADKTAKIWNISEEGSGTVQITFSFPESIDNMQIGCLWLPKYIITISLNGDINYLSISNPEKPLRILEGHTKSVTAIAVAPRVENEPQEYFSSSYNGMVMRWHLGIGPLGKVKGKGHGVASIKRMSVAGGQLITCGLDDTIRKSELPAESFSENDPIALKAQARDFSVSEMNPELLVCVTSEEVHVVKQNKIISTVRLDFEATAIGLSPSGTEVVIGASDGKLHVYSLNGDTLLKEAFLERHRAAITAVKYSFDGSLFASADQKPEIVVWDSVNREVKVKNMLYHTARVTCLAWSPNSSLLASGSVDMSAIVWDVNNSVSSRRTIKRAHPGGLTSVAFSDDSTLLTSGDDGCIREWALMENKSS